MRINKYSLIAALAVGSLLAFTNFASAQDAKAPPAPQAPQDGKKRSTYTPQQRVDRMATLLNLTDAQKTKVTALYEEDAKKIRELRADTNTPQDQRREKARALRAESDKKLQAILTPEQWEKWQKERQTRPPRGNAEPKTEKKAQ